MEENWLPVHDADDSDEGEEDLGLDMLDSELPPLLKVSVRLIEVVITLRPGRLRDVSERGSGEEGGVEGVWNQISQSYTDQHDETNSTGMLGDSWRDRNRFPMSHSSTFCTLS